MESTEHLQDKRKRCKSIVVSSSDNLSRYRIQGLLLTVTPVTATLRLQCQFYHHQIGLTYTKYSVLDWVTRAYSDTFALSQQCHCKVHRKNGGTSKCSCNLKPHGSEYNGFDVCLSRIIGRYWTHIRNGDFEFKPQQFSICGPSFKIYIYCSKAPTMDDLDSRSLGVDRGQVSGLVTISLEWTNEPFKD